MFTTTTAAAAERLLRRRPGIVYLLLLVLLIGTMALPIASPAAGRAQAAADPAAGLQFDVTPTTIPVSATVFITVSGEAPGTPYFLSYGTYREFPPLGVVWANAAGTVITHFIAPAVDYTARTSVHVDALDYRYGAARNIIVPQQLSVDPQSGPPGTTVVIRGAGYYALSAVSIAWDGTPMGGVGASLRGVFTDPMAMTQTVPLLAAPGPHLLSAQSTGIDGPVIGSTVFTVTAP